MPLVLLLLPLVVAAAIAAANANVVNDVTERAERWVRATQLSLATRTGWFSRFVLNPLLAVVVRLSDWTDDFQHRGLKNGVRAAVALYVLGAWGLILFVALQVIVGLAIAALVLYVAFRVLLSSSPDVRRGYEASRRILGPASRGQRVNPETGVVQEEGLLGWRDTDRRVDPESGRLQTQGFLGWQDTDTRIDQESGRVQEEGLLGFTDTDVRIHPETGVIQKMGLLGWQDTDQRIHPQSGRRQKQGLLGWVDE